MTADFDPNAEHRFFYELVTALNCSSSAKDFRAEDENSLKIPLDNVPIMFHMSSCLFPLGVRFMTVNSGWDGVVGLRVGVNVSSASGSIWWYASFHYGKDTPRSVSVGLDGSIDKKRAVISGRKATGCS
jgi:hypothetical protein